MTINAELHRDPDRGFLRRRCRRGYRPMAGFAFQARDHDVTPMRIERMIRHPEQLEEDIVPASRGQLLDFGLFGTVGLGLLVTPQACVEPGKTGMISFGIELMARVTCDPCVLRMDLVIESDWLCDELGRQEEHTADRVPAGRRNQDDRAYQKSADRAHAHVSPGPVHGSSAWPDALDISKYGSRSGESQPDRPESAESRGLNGFRAARSARGLRGRALTGCQSARGDFALGRPFSFR